MRNYKYLFTQVANDNGIYQFEYNTASAVVKRIQEDYAESNHTRYSLNRDFVINRMYAYDNMIVSARLSFRKDDKPEDIERNLNEVKDWYREEMENLDSLKIHFPDTSKA